MRLSRWTLRALAPLTAVLGAAGAEAQGVTTGSISGAVTQGPTPVLGAQVVALHQESGTRYSTTTRADGRFSIPSMRVGGPYQVTVTRLGLRPQQRNDVFVNLGQATDLRFSMEQAAVQLGAVTTTVAGLIGGIAAAPAATIFPTRIIWSSSTCSGWPRSCTG